METVGHAGACLQRCDARRRRRCCARGRCLRGLKSKARPKRGSGRANVTLHLLPCATRAGKASGIRSIPTIQRRRVTPGAGGQIDRAARITGLARERQVLRACAIRSSLNAFLAPQTNLSRHRRPQRFLKRTQIQADRFGYDGYERKSDHFSKQATYTKSSVRYLGESDFARCMRSAFCSLLN